MALALYRKWRSLTFTQMVGQEHITRTLENQVESRRISHAYLFTGTRGTGKTSCAKILARAVCCTHPQGGNPCNQCAACLSILDESALDVTEIDAASNNGVDNIRELREEAFFAPAALPYRVYIIDEVHMLSSGAFNALLKILEEPPSHVLFILATTEIHKVPATILSRCQRFDFRRIPPELIAAHLTQLAREEGFSLEADAAALLARLGDGSMRDAISLLDRSLPAQGNIDRARVTEALGIAPLDNLTAILDALLTENAGGALAAFTACYLGGQDIASIFNELLSLLRDIYLVKVTGREEFLTATGADYGILIRRFGAAADAQLLEFLIDCVSDLLRRLTRTAMKRTDAEMCLIKMALRHQSGVAAALPGSAAMTAPSAPSRAIAAPVAAPASQSDLPPWEAPTPIAADPSPSENPAVEAARPEQKPAPDDEEESLPIQPSAAGQSLPGDWKGKLLAAVSPRVNSAVRTYLNLADVENIENLLHIFVLEESLVFMEKPAVLRILEEGARALSCTGVKIKNRDKKASRASSAAPKGAPAPEEATASNPAEDILNRARSMGIPVVTSDS